MMKRDVNGSAVLVFKDTVAFIYRQRRVLAAVPFLLGLAACAAQPPAPRVFFQEPRSNANVTSPVSVKLGVEGFKIEPAGDVHTGAGHLHVMVDADCIVAGQPIPKDDKHIHLGKGQLETEITLAPGTHTFCLQAGDGVHLALDGAGMRQSINVTVK